MTEHEEEVAETGDAAGETETERPEREPPRRAGRGLAALALLVALAAAGAAGWNAWQARQSAGTGSDTSQRLAAMADRLARIEDRLGNLSRDLDAAGERARSADETAVEAASSARRAGEQADQARQSASDLAEEVASLQATLNEQDQRLADLGQRLDGDGGPSPDLALALAQAEYLVRTAYDIAQLERDPARAARALSMAGDRLRGLQAPGLTRAREALAGELEALRGVPAVDRQGLAARLAGLADRVPELPLRAGLGPASAQREPGRESEEPPVGDRGWWQATRDFMGEYFTVRRTDESGTALPAPGTLSLMRDVLRLALEQARLALLRGDAALYRQSLERADGLLAAYFAADAAAVRSARESVAALQDATVRAPLPELGEGLEALRAVRPESVEGG